MNNNIYLDNLLQKYIDGSISEAEKLQLIDIIDTAEGMEKFTMLIENLYAQAEEGNINYKKERADKMVRFILKDFPAASVSSRNGESAEDAPTIYSTPSQAEETDQVSRIDSSRNIFQFKWLRYTAAAIFAGVLGLAALKYIKPSPEQHKEVAVQKVIAPDDAMPGSNKAVLTLSNGKKVVLDEKGQQTITDEGVNINNNSGTVTYGKSTIVAFNTMTTPRGGQYKLTLPDGTKVWLNAASSITYPTAFLGDSREISITGEVYFEVSKNPLQPFIVNTYKDKITVKGTSFNVNSYTDEPYIKTSLLEGLVDINNALLQPGQSYIEGKIATANLEKDFAWKNGVFNFHHVKLKEAMRQIARWYDIDVSYKSNDVDVELGGEIGRNLSLKQVLNGLQDKEVRFKLEGKTLNVFLQ